MRFPSSQDAFATALERWPRAGLPANPGAWVITTARNRAIDRIRHERVRARKLELIGRLAKLLYVLMPDEPEALGLLALLLLQDSRRDARLDATGDLVLLGEQDRSLWDAAEIEEGLRLLDRAIAHRRPGPYQLQAAIAAGHAQGSSWEEIVAPATRRNGGFSRAACARCSRDSPSRGDAVRARVDRPDRRRRLPRHVRHSPP